MFNVELIGRLGGDAEVKQFGQGKEYVNFRMAVESDYRKPAEGRAPVVYWLSVASIQANHLAMAKYLTKGRLVFVRGNYEDKVGVDGNGQPIIYRNVKATEISFIPIGETTH